MAVKNEKAQKPQETLDLIDRSGKVVLSGVPFSEAMQRIEQSYREHGESQIGVEVVHIWLARTKGAAEDPVLILQRRSDNHKLDKAVGGHVSSGKTAAETVNAETSEEMGVKARITWALGQGALAGEDLSHDAMMVNTGCRPLADFG